MPQIFKSPQKILAWLPVFALFFSVQASNPPIVQAQESQPVQAPAVVVSTSKIDQFLGHVSYLLRSVGQPEIGGMASMLANQYTRGLDRSRPIGIAVNLSVQGNPEPIAMLPFTDLDMFFRGLEQINIGPPDNLGNDLYALDLGAQSVFAKKQGSWLLVSPDELSLTTFQGNPEAMLASLSESYDLGVRLDVKSIPPQFKELLVGQMKEAFERGTAQNMAQLERELARDEAAATTPEQKAAVAGRREGLALATEAQRLQLQQIEDLVDQTELLELGLVSDPTAKAVFMEVSVRFVKGSKLDQQTAKSAAATTQFGSLVRSKDTITLQSTNLMDPEQAVQAKQFIETGIESFIQNVSNGEPMPPEVNSIVEEIKAFLVASIDEGISDAALSVNLDNGVDILLGAHVVDGAKLAELVQKAYGMAKGQDIPKIEFNIETYKQVVLHRGVAVIPASAPAEVKTAFGQKVEFVIGTGPKSLFLSVAADPMTSIKTAIDASSAGSAPGQPLNMVVEFASLLQFVQKLSPNPVVDEMLRVAQQNSQNDLIVVTSKVVPQGSVSRITIEEGVLKAAGAAAKAGTGVNRRGGF